MKEPKMEVKKYCQNCASYDKKTKICPIKKDFTNRKGTCIQHTER